MNQDNIIALGAATKEDVKFVQEVSDSIISSHAAELDSIIAEIKTNIIDAPNQDDAAIEQYMLKLVFTLYLVNTKIDKFSFYDAVSDMKATLAYNEKYAESQANAVAANVKSTKDDHQHYAEFATADDKMLNLIYNRSVKALKDKIDGGYEILDVLKRILKHHEQEAFQDKQNRLLLE